MKAYVSKLLRSQEAVTLRKKLVAGFKDRQIKCVSVKGDLVPYVAGMPTPHNTSNIIGPWGEGRRYLYISPER